MKKIIILLSTILVLEIGLFAVIYFSIDSHKPAPVNSEKVFGKIKTDELAVPEKLTLRTIDENTSWTGEELQKLLQDINVSYIPDPHISLRSYFFSRVSPKKTGQVRTIRLEHQLLGERLLELRDKYNRPAQNAELIIEDSRATTFIPHKYGQVLDLAVIRDQISQAVLNNKQEIDLKIYDKPPRVLLSDLNDLGINERIARGTSDFSGSSRSRIHNISVGASRYDGLIIEQNQEFSFNEYLGPVTGSAGFLPELVIKAEGTVPEYGGGLCQVSTTAFRAAFFGGLDITQRKNHSYAVKYYKWINEEIAPAEGLDATIYPGVVDMKFVNDTKTAILIDTYIDGNRLYFDFYGTPDDRKVLVKGPETYDRRPSGAVKATVERTVYKNGQEYKDEFRSNYVSPNLFPRTYELQKEEKINTEEN